MTARDAVKALAEVAPQVLVDHQRLNIERCSCGWARLGYSFAEHVTEQLITALRARDDRETSGRYDERDET